MSGDLRPRNRRVRRGGRARVAGLRILVAGAIATTLAVAGSTAGYAYWTAAIDKGASVTNGNVAITTTGLTALATTYKPGLPGVSPSQLSQTAPVTVTNTGTAPVGLALAVSGGTASFNSLVTVRVWKQGATCTASTTVPGTATSGTLATLPALPADANTAAAGAAVVLCIRTTLSGTFETANNLSSTPTVTVTGAVGTNWTASTTNSFTQKANYNWYELVHTFSGKCAEISGGTNTAFTNIVLNACKPLTSASPQAFRFLDAGTAGYYRINSDLGTTTSPSWGAAPLLGLPGASVQLANYDTGLLTNNQQWSIEPHGTTGEFRIVHRGSGQCLNMGSSTNNTVFTITTCGTSTATTDATYRAQHFGFVEIPS